MPLLGASLVFILLIAVLGVLRTRLLFEFSSITLLCFNSANLGKWVYTLVFLPGTILHELSHWLTAELLGVRTGEITILPTVSSTGEGREKLGSVQTASSGPVRSFLIGAAPSFTGLALLYLFGFLLPISSLWWHYLLLFYGIIVVGSSMLLSAEDRRAWPFIGILLVVILTVFYVTPLEIPASFYLAVVPTVWTLNRVLALTVLTILGVIGLTYGLRRIIEKLVHKKVVTRR